MLKHCLALATTMMLIAAASQTAYSTPIILDLTSGVRTTEKSLGGYTDFDTYREDGFMLQVVPPDNHMDSGYSEGINWHDGSANTVLDNIIELTFNGGNFDFSGLEYGSINNFAVLVTGSNGASWTTSLGISGLQQPAPGTFSNVSWIRFDNASSVFLSTLYVDNQPAAATATPEPGSIILLATGGIGLVGGAVRRRRARKTLAA